ncbi:MAG: hypothetical protein KKF39_06215 [Nanoarchaeota archaeon]|nr:hypothetical protein [Nanoarchaeota archaeon]
MQRDFFPSQEFDIYKNHNVEICCSVDYGEGKESQEFCKEGLRGGYCGGNECQYFVKDEVISIYSCQTKMDFIKHVSVLTSDFEVNSNDVSVIGCFNS